MPNGTMRWFDPHTGDGRVARGGHEYPVQEADIERDARVPGARVHFDIHRDGGIERATNVSLRRGTRVSRRQHRFGDLAGARRPDAKRRVLPSWRKPDPDAAPAHRPLESARHWAMALAHGDWETARAFYAPDASIHQGAQTFRGPGGIHAYLNGYAHIPGAIDVHGDGDIVVVRWQKDDHVTEYRLRFRHGQIAEQW